MFFKTKKNAKLSTSAMKQSSNNFIDTLKFVIKSVNKGQVFTMKFNKNLI